MPSSSGSAAAISAAARRSMLKVPIRLMRMTRSNASSARGPLRPMMRPAVPTPAQFTRMRQGPWAVRAAAMAASPDGPLETSQAMPMPPKRAALASAAASLMSSTATLQPPSASSFAVAAPRPEAPPVTTAASPCRFIAVALRYAAGAVTTGGRAWQAGARVASGFACLVAKTGSAVLSIQPRGRPLPHGTSDRDGPRERKGLPMAWLLLLAAGALEIVWATALKQSEGFTRLRPSLVMIVAMAGSFALLAMAMRTLPLGVAYTVWTGIGAVGAFAVGVFVLGESASPMRLAAAGLIVTGLLLMKLSSEG